MMSLHMMTIGLKSQKLKKLNEGISADTAMNEYYGIVASLESLDSDDSDAILSWADGKDTDNIFGRTCSVIGTESRL